MPDRGEGEEGDVDLENAVGRRGDEDGGETDDEARSVPLRDRRDIVCRAPVNDDKGLAAHSDLQPWCCSAVLPAALQTTVQSAITSHAATCDSQVSGTLDRLLSDEVATTKKASGGCW